MNSETLSKEQRAILEANFEKWQAKKIQDVEFMEMFGLKKNTFYKVVKKYNISYS